MIKLWDELIFFKNWLEDTRSLWLPFLQKTFIKNVELNPVFTGEKRIKISRSDPEGRNDTIQVRRTAKSSLKTLTAFLINPAIFDLFRFSFPTLVSFL